MSYEPMNTAPRDGSPVLLKPRAGSGLKHPFVGRFHTGSEDWGFAAPVGFGGITDEWLDGWMALPTDGVIASDDAQDAARYRKLRGWMSSNVPKGWQEVERMGALCAWMDWAAMNDYLDGLPECAVGLMSKPADGVPEGSK